MVFYTLVNYHAGPGCLYAALSVTQLAGERLDWEHVSRHFDAGCDTVSYVENISHVNLFVVLPVAIHTQTRMPHRCGDNAG